MDSNGDKWLITGGSGMVGHALEKALPDAHYISSKTCDFRDTKQTRMLFNAIKPAYVVHLAARVGGVKANTDYVADFYEENMQINHNVLEACVVFDVLKVVSMLSTCIYPDPSLGKVTYPLSEDQLHMGEPHPSNFGYAFAKRMLDVQSRALRQQYGLNAITMCPNNLYGEHDNYDLNNSHVIPAIIRKVFEAKKHKEKSVVLWGDGTPLREFTYAPDIAQAILFLMYHYEEPTPVNIGNTEEITIKQAASVIAEELEYDGEIEWDISRPSGQHRKPMCTKKFRALGWQGGFTPFAEGIKNACDWFRLKYPNCRL